MIYLAHPIDLHGDSDSWREISCDISNFKNKVKLLGGSIFTPMSAFDLNVHVMTDHSCGVLAEINRYALSQCDAVVAFLHKNIQSVGVPIEIFLSSSREDGYSWKAKPVFVVMKDVDKSVMIRAMANSVKCRGNCQVYMFDNVDELYTTLCAAMDGALSGSEKFNPDDFKRLLA